MTLGVCGQGQHGEKKDKKAKGVPGSLETVEKFTQSQLGSLRIVLRFLVFLWRGALQLGRAHVVGRDIGHARRQVVDDAGALPVCSVEAETGVAQVDRADAHGARGAASCVLRRNGHTTTPLAGRSAAVAGSIVVVLESAVVVGTGPQTVSRLASRDASSHDFDLFDVVDAIGRLGVLPSSRLAGQLEQVSTTRLLTLGLM